MKKIFLYILLCIITIGCTCKETLTVYSLTDQEKTLNPYQHNEVIRWVDNANSTYTGVVTRKEDYNDMGNNCNRIEFQRIINYITFNDFYYVVYLTNSFDSIELSISEYNETHEIKKYFVNYTVSDDDFGDVILNGETYENAMLLKQRFPDGEPFGQLVYSKTHGIEFILFEDGTWYKRAE